MNAIVEAKVLSQLRRLPALPEALNELLLALDNEKSSQRAIALNISRDLSLTCKMLRIANSSFYGLSYHVASVHDALLVLGLRSVRSLAVATLMVSQLQQWAGSKTSLKHFFEHALETAICSQLLAKQLSIQSDTAFTAALLHDIGKLALVVEFPVFSELVLESDESMQDLELAGVQSLGQFKHAELGGKILAHWHFPASIQEAVRCHHDPVTTETSELTLLVVAANILKNSHWSLSERLQRLRESSILWDRLSLSEETLIKIESKASEGFEELVNILDHFDDVEEVI